MSNLNPYQPPVEISVRTGGDPAMEFRGQIERADYVAMLPRSRLGQWLFILIALLLVPFVVILCGVAVAMLFQPEDAIDFFGVLAALIILLSILTGLNFALVPVGRARRSLKRHPDLLTAVVGKMDSVGVTLENQDCLSWIGPALLKDCGISSKGMRIPLDADPYRYLALPARFFDAYRIDAAQGLKRSWGQAKKTFLPLELNLPWKPDQATDPFYFSGGLSIELPARTPKFRGAAIGSTFLALMMVGATVSSLVRPGQTDPLVFAVLAILLVGNTVVVWRRYLRGTYSQDWDQAGYVSTDALVIRNESAGWFLRPDQILQVRVDEAENYLAINETSELTFYIRREMLVDNQQWSRLVERLHRFASKQQQRPADTSEPAS